MRNLRTEGPLARELPWFAALALLLLLVGNALHPGGIDYTRDYFPASAGGTRVEGQLPEHGFETIDGEELAELAEYATGDTPDLVLLDARALGAYEQAHLPGAWQVDPYHIEDTLPGLMPMLQRDDLAFIVVYCRGGDCEDSLNLAHELVYLREIPLDMVRVYEGGILDWSARGGALVSGTERDGPAVDPAQWVDPEAEAETAGASGEPLVLALPLALLLAAAAHRRWRARMMPVLALAGAAVLAFYAAVKLADPVEFVKAVHGYGVLPTDPPWLLNLAGAGVPWMEAAAAACLLTGVLRRGAGAALSIFLVVFTIAVMIRAWNEAGAGFLGYAFDCGCGTGLVVVWQKVVSNLVLLGVLLTTVPRRAAR